MPHCQQFWVRKWAPGYVCTEGYLQSSYRLAGGSISDLDSVIPIPYGLQVSVNTPFDFENRWLVLRTAPLFRSKTEQKLHHEKQQEKTLWYVYDSAHQCVFPYWLCMFKRRSCSSR